MPDKFLPSGSLLTRKKYILTFKAACVRQMAAGACQADLACAQGPCLPCSAVGSAKRLFTPTAIVNAPAQLAGRASQKPRRWLTIRPGNPYKNAQAETGWSTLQVELLPRGGVCVSLEEA